MSIKMIATDMDGTLLTGKKTITPRAQAAIEAAKNQGVQFVLTTGRPLRGVKEYVDQLGLDGTDNFVITFNGAFVQASNGHVVKAHFLNRDDAQIIFDLSQKLPVNVHFETLDRFITPEHDLNGYLIAESFLTRMLISIRQISEIDEHVQISKAMYTGEPEQVSKAVKQLPKDFLQRYAVVQSEPFFIEINKKTASKGQAVRELAQQLGIAETEVMVLGDQDNDRTMFENPAFLKIAMGNAIPDIKQLADNVTTTNEQEGFAKAIEKYVLEV